MRHTDPVNTYYCHLCDKFHNGYRGVCTYCGYPSRQITRINLTKERARQILKEYPTEEEFVRRRFLKGIGPLYKEWDNTYELSLMYRRCLELNENQ